MLRFGQAFESEQQTNPKIAAAEPTSNRYFEERRANWYGY
jgi:hypothetical protein